VKQGAKKVASAKSDVEKSLTPWIPGDFIVVYGTLLTAWPATIPSSFRWLLVIASASAVVFVLGGAFSTGLKSSERGRWQGKQECLTRSKPLEKLQQVGPAVDQHVAR
jgi:hypothetical protein